jgi:CheY-like chemotaxis protein
MDTLLRFVQDHKLYFDAAHALSSVISLIGWCLGAFILTVAWRRHGIKFVSLGPLSFQMQEAAVEAAATAARDWQAKSRSQPVDVTRIRETVAPAFSPETADRLTGKSILWVDDNPAGNELAVRALRKLRLDVEQVTSTESALATMQRRHFDLVISDMGRGSDMRAGYGLLKAIRDQGNQVPYLIFASSDRPEFRREAAERGAQLSTNDLLELLAHVIKYLGADGNVASA